MDPSSVPNTNAVCNATLHVDNRTSKGEKLETSSDSQQSLSSLKETSSLSTEGFKSKVRSFGSDFISRVARSQHIDLAKMSNVKKGAMVGAVIGSFIGLAGGHLGAGIGVMVGATVGAYAGYCADAYHDVKQEVAESGGGFSWLKVGVKALGEMASDVKQKIRDFKAMATGDQWINAAVAGAVAITAAVSIEAILPIIGLSFVVGGGLFIGLNLVNYACMRYKEGGSEASQNGVENNKVSYQPA